MSNLISDNKRNKKLAYPLSIFADFFNDNRFAFNSISAGYFRLDVTEENDCYLVEAELPGIKKENIFVDLADGRLLIGVEQNEEIKDDNKKYIQRERHYSSMQRSVYLGDVKSDGITAKLENGILRVRVRKDVHKPKSNRIEIQ